ncbi:unnamed protein product [Ilex paraguariensis]|uniref:Uncharacterized protein n=1 Tax=Ilex paraguariensis TaxID=185542 RepID=A0ABC8UM21_9AQUA
METASCPVLNPLRFSSITNNNSRLCDIVRTHLHFLPSFSPTFPRKLNFCGKSLQFNRFTVLSSPSSHLHQNPSQELAVLLEVEGVLMDVYRLGNRQAFNVAFQKLGLDCAKWTEPIYLDLLRKSGGDEERMLVLYFNQIGWPTSLPTAEKGSFMKSVLREKVHIRTIEKECRKDDVTLNFTHVCLKWSEIDLVEKEEPPPSQLSI